ncbi:ras-related protein Rap-2b-like [Watersipora subatra]|uniref:ras-related protein Rap-2b-like n=1 Tax=Watersipora subatra TaxID=2589382 RepID=UPI00355B5B2C
MREFKVVLFGSGGVGKSAVTVQFVAGRFVQNYNPTVEDVYRKDIEVNKEPCVIEVLDTAGTEQFASMRDLYIRNGEGFIIVYGINNYQSFKDVMLMQSAIRRIKRKKEVPIILVGNKCDLQFEREVTAAEGQQLADIWDVPFIETSAKKRHNINELFMEIVQQINKKNKKGSGCCCTIL